LPQKNCGCVFGKRLRKLLNTTPNGDIGLSPSLCYTLLVSRPYEGDREQKGSLIKKDEGNKTFISAVNQLVPGKEKCS
jgi:hypothetical protein